MQASNQSIILQSVSHITYLFELLPIKFQLTDNQVKIL